MRRLLARSAFTLIVSGILIVALFPFYYALVSSFRTGTELFIPRLWPERFDLTNYAQIFTQQAFGLNILNSMLVAIVVVAVSLFLGMTAAYALARMRFRGRGPMLFLILAVSMFPQIAVLSGMFELVRALGLYDRLPGLMLANLVLTLPFTVWILTTFMRELPKELEEAAIADGATPWQTARLVFLPLMLPAMVPTGLLAFILAWNEFLFAFTLTLSSESRTVPVAIALLSGGSRQELPWGPIMAASVVVTLPLIVLVLIFQRKIVAGLTAGAVKG
ncbi:MULTISPECIES: carbohydrate ABC transporter permease [unclassified Chelatococcus]|uniref:carbohydrate ABC transporter permease n=1 Tax=unclassified Chelatococcus TaxID=2638111 RepID=UPI001BCE79A1|nr:carbohydrate ABC transporter permease [Chelatococcus sp.]MBS7741845.1 carbohydrate ABC transporter permease [Chelatococcus sp. HY11]MBX3541357.1 carbohydrate ABC transporter permease [Chelatococcus sp.]MCO5074749.1 carbohydrate ABC transporter permease [Chelatococcus sp.]